MRYIIRWLGMANGSYCRHLGWYLQSFRNEAGNGRGFGKFTPHLHTGTPKRSSRHSLKLANLVDHKGGSVSRQQHELRRPRIT